MHETSVIQSLLALIVDQLSAEGAVRVKRVKLRVGPLAGVAIEALRFAYEAAIVDTAFAESTLEIVESPLIGWCANCGEECKIVSAQRLRCVVCGASTSEIICGRELELEALEIVDIEEESHAV